MHYIWPLTSVSQNATHLHNLATSITYQGETCADPRANVCARAWAEGINLAPGVVTDPFSCMGEGMSGGVAQVCCAECWERKSQFTRGSVFGKKMSARELVLKTELLTCWRFFFFHRGIWYVRSLGFQVWGEEGMEEEREKTKVVMMLMMVMMVMVMLLMILMMIIAWWSTRSRE